MQGEGFGPKAKRTSEIRIVQYFIYTYTYIYIFFYLRSLTSFTLSLVRDTAKIHTTHTKVKANKTERIYTNFKYFSYNSSCFSLSLSLSIPLYLSLSARISLSVKKVDKRCGSDVNLLKSYKISLVNAVELNKPQTLINKGDTSLSLSLSLFLSHSRCLSQSSFRIRFGRFFVVAICCFAISDVRCKYFCCICFSFLSSHFLFSFCLSCIHTLLPRPFTPHKPCPNESRVQWRIFHHHATVSDAAASVSLTMFPAAEYAWNI